MPANPRQAAPPPLLYSGSFATIVVHILCFASKPDRLASNLARGVIIDKASVLLSVLTVNRADRVPARLAGGACDHESRDE